MQVFLIPRISITVAVFLKICYSIMENSENLRKELFVMKIMESAENYLETILVLSKRKPHVRSIDIATELSFSKPSVSVAMKNLRENGYVLMDPDGYLTPVSYTHLRSLKKNFPWWTVTETSVPSKETVQLLCVTQNPRSEEHTS